GATASRKPAIACGGASSRDERLRREATEGARDRKRPYEEAVCGVPFGKRGHPRDRRPVAYEGKDSQLRGWRGMYRSTPRSAGDHVRAGVRCESSLPVIIAAHGDGRGHRWAGPLLRRSEIGSVNGRAEY